jgi:hypothetical protein
VTKKVIPIRPDKVRMFGHPTEAQLGRLVGIGWSVQLGADYVTLTNPIPREGEEPNIGWALTPSQARELAHALLTKATQLEVEQAEKERR